MVFLAYGNLRGEGNMSRFNKIDMDKHTKTRMARGARRNAAADYSNSGIKSTDENKRTWGEVEFICSIDSLS